MFQPDMTMVWVKRRIIAVLPDLIVMKAEISYGLRIEPRLIKCLNDILVNINTRMNIGVAP